MKNKKENIPEQEEYLRTIRQCNGIINKICYFYARTPEDFKDLRQDVLAEIWHSFSTFRGNASISTWVYRITLNICISSLRRQKRYGKQIGLESLPDLIAEEGDSMERNKLLYSLINTLRNEDKAIILMWLDEMPYEEIAQIMGMSRNTLATRLRRIKQSLARQVSLQS